MHHYNLIPLYNAADFNIHPYREFFMTASMTAFARQEMQLQWGSLTWELRSVNHRYLELQFRLPEHLRELEPKLRNLLRNKLSRGKVECSLVFRANDQTSSDQLMLNMKLLNELKSVIGQIDQQVPQVIAPSALELMRWPGLLQSEKIPYDEVKEHALSSFELALDQLITMRHQEGSALFDLIEQRLDQVNSIAVIVRNELPKLCLAQKQRLLNKIEEVKVNLDPARLEQEVVLLLQKADVDEELDRLETHVKEVRRTLNKPEAIGRRLDFLMQELNREANTLSSKAIDTNITQSAVELKVLIEQMREQIQNIE